MGTAEARAKCRQNRSSYNKGCRCEKCCEAARKYTREYQRQDHVRQWHRAYYSNRYATNDRGFAETVRTSQAQINAESRPTARNSGKQWTGPELEIVRRADLTAAEAAAMLGRTFWAVKTVRRDLQRDPRKWNFL